MSKSAKTFDVFLSCSRQDVQRAKLVFEALGRQGWAVFLDEKIPNATLWEKYN